MTTHRTARAAIGVLCVLTLAGCAKQVDPPATGSARSTAAGPTTSRPLPEAHGAPIGQGHGEAHGGPVADGAKDGQALASPITIPAIQQQGQPVDDDPERYPGGVIGYVENAIREQCPDGTLCGFTVTAARHEPDPPADVSAPRDFCAFTQSPDQQEPVTHTEPAVITLNCVWHYTEPVDPSPVPDPETPGPATDTSTPGSTATTTTEADEVPQ